MARSTRMFLFVFVCVLLLVNQVVRADLVAHWALDEEAGTSGEASILDSGPSEMHHGTPMFPESPLILGVPGVTEETGTALQCTREGTGIAGVDVPHDPALNPDSFTVSLWAFPNSASTPHQSVITSRHDMFPSLAGYILYSDPAGNWSFWTGREGSWHGLNHTTPVVPMEWTHLALRYDGESMTKTIFVNGEPVSAGSDNGLPTYLPNMAMDLHIGTGGDLGTQYPFDGVIDEVMIWDMALTDGEIGEVMDDFVVLQADNLVAHWKLDEPEGTLGAGSIEDSTGNGHNGNLMNFELSLGEPGANENTATAASISSVTIDVPYAMELNPESFTVAAWVYPRDTAGYQSVITSRHDAIPGQETRGYILYNDVNGNWAFWTGHGAPGWPAIVGTPVEIDTWQHVAFSFDALTMTKTLYVNGTLVASDMTQGYVPNEFQGLHIGGGGDLGNEFQFNGMIDDVGLWDEVLAEEDIQEIMENGVSSEPVVDEVNVFVGDTNSDGNINLADAISLLTYLFVEKTGVNCLKSADANDDDKLDLADAISILTYQFSNGTLTDPEHGILDTAGTGCHAYPAQEVSAVGCETPCTAR